MVVVYCGVLNHLIRQVHTIYGIFRLNNCGPLFWPGHHEFKETGPTGHLQELWLIFSPVCPCCKQFSSPPREVPNTSQTVGKAMIHWNILMMKYIVKLSLHSWIFLLTNKKMP